MHGVDDGEVAGHPQTFPWVVGWRYPRVALEGGADALLLVAETLKGAEDG